MNKFLQLIICYSLPSFFGMLNVIHAQRLETTSATNSFQLESGGWATSLNQKFFTENKGQVIDSEKEVFFSTKINGNEVAFYDDGFSFTTIEIESRENYEESKDKEEKLERRKLKKHTFEIQFEGKTDVAYYEGQDKLTHYSAFSNGKEAGTIIASNYNTLLYKNVWQNIDIAFLLPEEGGLKYNFILHSGANVKDIKLSYLNATPKLLPNGNLSIQTAKQVYNDKKPFAYIEKSSSEVGVQFVLNKNTLSFQVDSYDNNEALVIDPWITTPIAALDNKGYRVEYDNSGNVYVLGGFTVGGGAGMQVNKYNPSGDLLWTWEALDPYSTSHCGDITCRKSTGELYWTRGYASEGDYSICRLSTDGVLTENWDHTMDGAAPEEFWLCFFDECSDQVIIGSGGVGFSSGFTNQCTRMSPDLSTINYEEVFGLAEYDVRDVCLADLDPDGNSAYFVVAGNYLSAENTLFKISLPDFSTVYYTIDSGHSFEEIGSVAYNNFSNGFSGMAAGVSYLYTYDGNVVNQHDKATGAIVGSVTLGTAAFKQSGIDTDFCGNVYVGTVNEVKVFNSSLVEIGSYSLPDTCFGVRTSDNKLYATGVDFVSEIDITPVDYSVAQTPSTCDECNGTATLSLTPCEEVINDYEISWQPSGQTTATAVDLCEGDHTVYLIMGCDTLYTETVTVENICGVQVNVPDSTICEGVCIDLVSTITDETGTVTFSWEHDPLETTGTVNVCPTETTTYRVIATDDLNSDTAFVTVTVLPMPVVNLGNDTTLCAGETLVLNAENPGATYLWNTGSTAQTDTVTTAGTYHVMVNNEGCIAYDTITVNVLDLTVDLGADQEVCELDIVLDAGNPTANFIWQDGTTAQTFNATLLGVYHVSVTDTNGCTVSDTISFTAGELTVDLGNDTVLCESATIALDAGNPGATFLWSSGTTDQTETVNSAGGYWVQVNQGFCAGADSIMISFSSPIVAFSVSDTTGCAPQQVRFTDSSVVAEGIASWLWNFGDGTTSTLQNPLHIYPSNGTYEVTLTVTTNLGCVATSEKSITVDIHTYPTAAFMLDPNFPAIDQEITFTDQSDNAVSWEWDFGDGNSSTEQNPKHTYINHGTYSIKLVADNFGCADSVIKAITINEPLVFYVPNAFTPDGNPFNEVFKPIFTSGFDPYDYKFTVLNRWGEVLFVSYDATVGWNGKYGGQLVNDGVYVYKIEFGDINSDKKYAEIGHFSLFK